MRILVVGMHNSPHLHRWIQTIDDGRVTILIFPVLRFEVGMPDHFRQIGLDEISSNLAPGVWVVDPLQISDEGEIERYAEWDFVRCSHTFVPSSLLASPHRLWSAMKDFRPDILHSLETQMAGYLCLDTLREVAEVPPPWIASSWGSDLNLFHRFGRHRDILQRFCSRIDYFLSDCTRDLALARRLGYAGPALRPMPATGGADIERQVGFATCPPSARRSIIVKGYHNWAGRSLLALSALMLARRSLEGFSIGILAPDPQPKAWAARMQAEFGLDIEALPYLPNPEDAMRRMANARIIIGVSISDGMPTTVLEAMSVGAFPIQTSSSCVNEWIVDGETGILVSPHDTHEMAQAIKRVLADDDLVDSAAERNLAVVRQRWCQNENRRLVWEIYRSIAGDGVQ